MGKNYHPSRRKVLKLLGGSAATLSIGSSQGAAAGQEPTWQQSKKIYEQARRVLSETASVERFRRYLANHDINYVAKDVSYNVTHSGDEPSAQYLDEEDLQIWLTLSRPNCYYPDRYHAELSWNWGWQDADDWGYYPDDAVGLTWSDRHFWLPDLDGDEFWTNHSYVDYESRSTEGIGFSHYDYGGDDDYTYSAGAEVRWRDATSDSSSERQIIGEYEHTWSGSWSGMSISVGYVSLSWNDPGGSWDTQEDHNDTPLVVNAADLSHDDCEYGM